MNEHFFEEDFLLRLERLSLAARKSIAGQTQGERRSPRKGNSVEFSDFRPYTHGDDFRRIDWNAYARLDRFFIKLFVEEEDISVHLLLDTSASMRWGQPDKLEYAARTAGALGYITLCGLDRVSVTLLRPVGVNGNANYFPFHRGKRQAVALFDFLMKAMQQKKGQPGVLNPVRQMSAYLSRVRGTGIAILLSDLLDDGWMEAVGMLAGRGFETSVIHILSPDEVSPGIEGDLKLIDSEKDASLEITADYEMLARYRKDLSAWQASWQQYCSKRAVNYIPVQSDVPLEELLFTWMRRKGSLK